MARLSQAAGLQAKLELADLESEASGEFFCIGNASRIMEAKGELS